jgi:nitrogen-specific signal transduction histidine kinase
VLGEISARFAHEIRNPLVIAGGFARRLCNSLPEEDKSRKLAEIILEEVSKLEQILRIMLSSIEPFTLCISEIDLNHLLRSLLDEMGDMVVQKQVYLYTNFHPNLPTIQIDEGLLYRAVESLVRHAIQSMPQKKDLMIATDSENNHLILTIKYYEEDLSEKDLEQFFFPRITGKYDASNVELPLSRVIIDRHGGKIEINAAENHLVIIRVALPIEQEKG